MKREDRGQKTEDKKAEDWFIQRGFDPLPFPVPVHFKQKCCQGYNGDQVDNAYGPSLDGGPGERSEYQKTINRVTRDSIEKVHG